MYYEGEDEEEEEEEEEGSEGGGEGKGEGDASPSRRRRTMQRQGRFAHFSDSDDEDLAAPGRRQKAADERTRETPQQDTGEEKFLNYEKQEILRQERLDVARRMEKVAMRQRKLRPRLVVHLVDEEDGSEEERDRRAPMPEEGWGTVTSMLGPGLGGTRSQKGNQYSSSSDTESDSEN